MLTIKTKRMVAQVRGTLWVLTKSQAGPATQRVSRVAIKKIDSVLSNVPVDPVTMKRVLVTIKLALMDRAGCAHSAGCDALADCIGYIGYGLGKAIDDLAEYPACAECAECAECTD